MIVSSLTDKTVVVAGGSEGIGMAVAIAARDRGADIVILGRSKPKLASALDRLGSQARGIDVDIADRDGVSRAISTVDTIDHVYIAAGAFVAGSILEGDIDAYRRAIDVRIWGSAYLIRASAPMMRRGGSFVLTGGLASSRPHAGAWVTSVATAAAEQMARAVCLELAPLGLRANAVSPGWTDTPMWDGVLGDQKEARLRAVRDQIPTGQVARPEEVASAVILLFENGAVNGEVIHVDGGHRWA